MTPDPKVLRARRVTREMQVRAHMMSQSTMDSSATLLHGSHHSLVPRETRVIKVTRATREIRVLPALTAHKDSRVFRV